MCCSYIIIIIYLRIILYYYRYYITFIFICNECYCKYLFKLIKRLMTICSKVSIGINIYYFHTGWILSEWIPLSFFLLLHFTFIFMPNLSDYFTCNRPNQVLKTKIFFFLFRFWFRSSVFNIVSSSGINTDFIKLRIVM